MPSRVKDDNKTNSVSELSYVPVTPVTRVELVDVADAVGRDTRLTVTSSARPSDIT